MRIVAVCLASVVLAACGGGSGDGGVITPPPQGAFVEVVGPTCSTDVNYWVNSVSTYPNEHPVQPPWSEEVAGAASGDHIDVLAVVTCLFQGEQTITARVRWRGSVIATQSETGPYDYGSMSGPGVVLGVDLP